MRRDQFGVVPFGTGCLKLIRKVVSCTGEGSVAGALRSTRTFPVVLVTSAMLVLVAGQEFEVVDFVVGSQEVRGDCGRYGQSKVLVEAVLGVCGLVGASV